VTEPHKSRDHTELLLPAYGVEVGTAGLTVRIAGGQRLHACDVAVPGDPSSAAFLLVAAALIPGSEVTVREVLLNPTRTGFLEVMGRMGADIAIKTSNISSLGAEKVGDITVRYRRDLTATTIEAREIPALIDEIPILALLATTAVGTTAFEQVGELRVKESDRLAAIIAGLNTLGCTASAHGDDLHVGLGFPQATAAVLETHGDHRLAMTWAVAARAFAPGLAIPGSDCVSVSYPGFSTDLERLS
jgi:3-phosphoshikimate 1-carboxyvinyltransferase